MEGSTFIDGLDQELNFEAIFQSLTVEKTNAAKRTRKSRSQTEAALKSVVFITNQTHGDLYESMRSEVTTSHDDAEEMTLHSEHSGEDEDTTLHDLGFPHSPDSLGIKLARSEDAGTRFKIPKDNRSSVSEGAASRSHISDTSSPRDDAQESSRKLSGPIGDAEAEYGNEAQGGSKARRSSPALAHSESQDASGLALKRDMSYRYLDGSPRGIEEDEEDPHGWRGCPCTPRSTDSDDDRNAKSPAEAWRLSFHRMKCQMDQTLNEALDARKIDRTNVYTSKNHLARIADKAGDVAERWSQCRYYKTSRQLPHPRIKKQELQRLERKRLQEERQERSTEERQQHAEKWTPYSLPEVVLRRQKTPLDSGCVHDAQSEKDKRELPLKDVTFDHPATVWGSIWTVAHTEKEKQTKNMNRCIELYSKIVNFCSHISYPSTAFQETFVGHLRNTLTQGGEVTQDILFDLLLAFDRRSIESRDSMKLIHFIREELGITHRQFFHWLQDQGWKLTVELKNLKKRLINEKKL
jgi:hypothetical protein